MKEHAGGGEGFPRPCSCAQRLVRGFLMPAGGQGQKQAIREYRRHEKDTGSSEVQVALLTQRINHLAEHLKGHKKDFSTRRGLLVLVGKRSALLKYLSRTDFTRYQDLIKRLGIRK